LGFRDFAILVKSQNPQSQNQKIELKVLFLIRWVYIRNTTSFMLKQVLNNIIFIATAIIIVVVVIIPAAHGGGNL